LLHFIFATFWATFVGQLQDGKMAFFKKVLTFLAELLGTSCDIHKSEVKFLEIFFDPSPFKNFPSLLDFVQDHICHW
jgi:hypothetical protein